MKALNGNLVAVLFALTAAGQAQAAGICYADSEPKLGTCVAGVNDGTYDKIEITKSIACIDKADTCSYTLRGVGGPARNIDIYGTTKRIIVYRNAAATLFRLEDVHNLSLRNLKVVDRRKRPLDYNSCSFQRPDSAPLIIGGNTLTGAGPSSLVTLDGLEIDTGEPDVMELGAINGLAITNSKFSGSGHFGIWMSSVEPKKNLRITNSTFTNIGANAILMSGVDGLWIEGNDFYGNHRGNPFCMPNGQHTGGGQMLVEGGTTNLTLQNNKIHDGGNPAVSGVEFADGSTGAINNILITQNAIYNNNNGGVVLNPPLTQEEAKNVFVKNNAFDNNPAGNVIPAGHKDINISDNTYTRDTSQSPQASFEGTARSCRLNGGALCSVQIAWKTQNLPSANVMANSALLSINPAGSVTAPWISQEGVVFELFAATGPVMNEPIARVYVKGVQNVDSPVLLSWIQDYSKTLAPGREIIAVNRAEPKAQDSAYLPRYKVVSAELDAAGSNPLNQECVVVEISSTNDSVQNAGNVSCGSLNDL